VDKLKMIFESFNNLPQWHKAHT